MIKTVTLNGEEIEVEFSYYPACRGSRDSYGVPLEPDEPEDIEIESVMFKGVNVMDLIGGEIKDVEVAIWNELEQEEDDWEDYEWEDAA